MWMRTELKKKARTLLKQNYWKAVSVCFIIAMLTTAYPVSTTFISLQNISVTGEPDAAFALDMPNSEIVIQTVSHFFEGVSLPGIGGRIVSAAGQIMIDMFSNHITLFFNILRSANAFLSEGAGIGLILTAAGLLLAFLYQIFINNLLLIGEKRFFMEIHSYRGTMISKIFFLFKLRCLRRPAWVMFCRTLFQSLWDLTIVGGIIKHYEYSMIPFILAENPQISRRDAFFLSRQLTAHNKWRLFLLDLSFAGWTVLSVLTLGLLEFFLEHVPSEDELLIRKALYDDSKGPYTKISYFAPEQYPVFLFSVQPPLRAVRSPLKAGRKYDACTMLFLFHAFSLFGWLLEMLVHLVQNGTFNNDTMFFAPWVPLYGLFGILSLALTKRVVQKPALAFAVCFAVYSLLEYTSNLVSDLLLGFPFRDYSGFLLNLNGRIYPGGSAVFALLGCGFIYFLAPKWAEQFEKAGRPVRWAVCIILTLLLAADTVFAPLRS